MFSFSRQFTDLKDLIQVTLNSKFLFVQKSVYAVCMFIICQAEQK